MAAFIRREDVLARTERFKQICSILNTAFMTRSFDKNSDCVALQCLWHDGDARLLMPSEENAFHGKFWCSHCGYKAIEAVSEELYRRLIIAFEQGASPLETVKIVRNGRQK